jgi:DNA-directed RNA polymerase beta subunit
MKLDKAKLNLYSKLRSFVKTSQEKKEAAARPDMTALSSGTLLKTTQKLLHINQGVTDPDERDSLRFKSVYTPDRLFRERIKLDAGRLGASLMRRISKARSLKPVNIAAFDPYVESLLVGNSLSTPLEEINPMHLVEQQRRITLMGEGGIGSEDAITTEMQNVHPHQFGFIDTIAGPESAKIGVDSRAAWGTMIGDNGLLYQKFKDNKTGKFVWLSPRDLHGKTLGLPN